MIVTTFKIDIHLDIHQNQIFVQIMISKINNNNNSNKYHFLHSFLFRFHLLIPNQITFILIY
jgi:hypothetical protein